MRNGYVQGKITKKDWERWYHTERWAKLRIRVLARDKFICQRTGELCTGKGNSPNAPVVNHKKPHRGNPNLFWDMNNLETVTKAVHDGLIQREEKNNKVIGNDEEGRPVDPSHPWNTHPVEEQARVVLEKTADQKRQEGLERWRERKREEKKRKKIF